MAPESPPRDEVPEPAPTPQLPLVVIGLSAGGFEPLLTVVGSLDPDLPASVVVCMHLSPQAPSSLTGILRRRTTLEVEEATDRAGLRRGRVYVAPPNRHLFIENGLVRVRWGPRQDGYRPSIDLLLESAAAGERPVIAVLLSGARSDGTAGAKAVKAAGGAVVIQDPEEAVVPSMILSVSRAVEPDAILPSAEIAPWIGKRVADPDWGGPGPSPARSEDWTPSQFNCPDCGGVLWETPHPGLPQRFRCRVGHAWSPDRLAEAGSTRIEDALWTALQIIEEQMALDQRLLDHARARGLEGAVERIDRRMARRREVADGLVEGLGPED